jgi:hypothetical protein
VKHVRSQERRLKTASFVGLPIAKLDKRNLFPRPEILPEDLVPRDQQAKQNFANSLHLEDGANAQKESMADKKFTRKCDLRNQLICTRSMMKT